MNARETAKLNKIREAFDALWKAQSEIRSEAFRESMDCIRSGDAKGRMKADGAVEAISRLNDSFAEVERRLFYLEVIAKES